MEKEETNDNKVQLRPSSSHSHDSLYERICQTLTIKEQANHYLPRKPLSCCLPCRPLFFQVDVSGGASPDSGFFGLLAGKTGRQR